MSPDRSRGVPVPAVEPNPAWTRRKLAAHTYRPRRVKLLIVVDAPPEDLERYVYFDAGSSTDPLFEQIRRVVFDEGTDETEGSVPPRGRKKSPGPAAPSRLASKAPYLRELRARGIFVIELKPDAPRTGEALDPYVPWFVFNLEPLAPEHIVLVGSDLDRAARAALHKQGLSIVDARVPTPEEGKGVDFRRELRRALVQAGLSRLIRPLPPRARAALLAAESEE